MYNKIVIKMCFSSNLGDNWILVTLDVNFEQAETLVILFPKNISYLSLKKIWSEPDTEIKIDIVLPLKYLSYKNTAVCKKMQHHEEIIRIKINLQQMSIIRCYSK